MTNVLPLMMYAFDAVASLTNPSWTNQASSTPAFSAIILPIDGYSSCAVLISRRPHRCSGMEMTRNPFDGNVALKLGIGTAKRTTVSGVVRASGKTKDRVKSFGVPLPFGPYTRR